MSQLHQLADKPLRGSWCQTQATTICVIGRDQRIKLKRLVRYPRCKRRYRSFIRECQDQGCLHQWMPPHKRR